MHVRFVHFFKFTKYSHIAEVLTLNDVLYWGGDAFVSVVLALFVTQYIDGGTASSVGIAYLIYRLTSAVSTTFVGKMLDKYKGFRDEIWALFTASFLAGLTYIFLSTASQLWHLYLAMGALGICRSFDINSWKLIFYSHLESDKRGRAIGTYDAIYGVAMGAIAALAGFVGDVYGFRVVVLVAGLIIMTGSLPVLSLRTDKAL